MSLGAAWDLKELAIKVNAEIMGIDKSKEEDDDDEDNEEGGGDDEDDGSAEDA